MKHTKETSLWGGRRDEDVGKLDADVPMLGEVKDKRRPMLEEFRKFSNAYYRYYNDGDAYYNKLRHMANRFGITLSSYREETMEELGDAVIDAALVEQAGIKALEEEANA
jgi:hypothetical protein